MIGSLAPFGDNPRLEYASRTTSFKGQDVLDFIWREVGCMTSPVGEVSAGFEGDRRCVIVLDNYSPHHGKEIREQSGALKAAGIELFYLPPYSPELNLIESMWRHVKHEDMPVRSHSTADELKVAVDTALCKRATALREIGAIPSAPALVLAHAHTTNYLSEAA